MTLALVLAFAAYTNHAGFAVSGVPVALGPKHVVLSNDAETVRLPLSTFPEEERRRLAADYAARTGDLSALRLPADLRRALEGCGKLARRSARRAEAGLCDEADADRTADRTEAARRALLDRALRENRLTPAEHRLLNGD